MNTTDILKSFKPQSELNPKIWYLPNEKRMGDPEGQKYKMRPEVRERLLFAIPWFFPTRFSFSI